MQSIMMSDSSNLQKEQLMHACHASMVDTHYAAAATCTYKLDVCNTYKGVLNKMINMFAGGYEWALVRELEDWFDEWDENALWRSDDRFKLVWSPTDRWVLGY